MGNYVGKNQVEVKTLISKEALVEALRDLTINNEDFDHRKWSLWDAEVFERIATMIRSGYHETRGMP